LPPVGAWRNWLLARCREREFTLRGLVAELGERGLAVDYRTVWTFVHVEGLGHKKGRRSPRSGTARTWRAGGRSG
jgi:putative transposase